jgi:hypothetical protein
MLALPARTAARVADRLPRTDKAREMITLDHRACPFTTSDYPEEAVKVRNVRDVTQSCPDDASHIR